MVIDLDFSNLANINEIHESLINKLPVNSKNHPKYINKNVEQFHCYDYPLSISLRINDLKEKSFLYDLCGWSIGLDAINDPDLPIGSVLKYRILLHNVNLENNPELQNIIKNFAKDSFYCEDNTNICIKKITASTDTYGRLGLAYANKHSWAILDLESTKHDGYFKEKSMISRNTIFSIPNKNGKYSEQVTINIKNENFLKDLKNDLIKKDLENALKQQNLITFPNKDTTEIPYYECTTATLTRSDHLTSEYLNDYCDNNQITSTNGRKFGDSIKYIVFFIYNYTPSEENELRTQNTKYCNQLLEIFKQQVKNIDNNHKSFIIYSKYYDYEIFYGRNNPCQILHIQQIWANYGIHSKNMKFTKPIPMRDEADKLAPLAYTLNPTKEKYYDQGFIIANYKLHITEPIEDYMSRGNFNLTLNTFPVINSQIELEEKLEDKKYLANINKYESKNDFFSDMNKITQLINQTNIAYFNYINNLFNFITTFINLDNTKQPSNKIILYKNTPKNKKTSCITLYEEFTNLQKNNTTNQQKQIDNFIQLIDLSECFKENTISENKTISMYIFKDEIIQNLNKINQNIQDASDIQFTQKNLAKQSYTQNQKSNNSYAPYVIPGIIIALTLTSLIALMIALITVIKNKFFKKSDKNLVPESNLDLDNIKLITNNLNLENAK